MFPIPSSHHSPSDRSVRSPLGQVSAATESRTTSVASIPSPLCRWTIHVSQPYYENLPDPTPPQHGPMNSADPGTYQPWPKEWKTPSYSQRLRNALESNDFSSIPTGELPVAVPEALQLAKRDPCDLNRESLGFAIMSRNHDMIRDLLYTDDPSSVMKGIDVFHLATSYLDGSKTCCDIINTISKRVPLRQHFTNDLGHTVLDNLMIAIVKGHSSCAPRQLDEAFKGQNRFAGEEVDICGRWDADSSCIQELLAKGVHHIPFQWKHKFCHTSVQTICHSITTIWGARSAPDINTCSGLFVRRCSQPHCGLKMQMTPLHTLVLVTLQLSSQGCEEEDLFGAVAVFLLLLRYGANPLLQSDLSITSLIGATSSDYCDHESDKCEHDVFDPLQLANAIYALKNIEWTDRVRLGWRTCSEILRHSQQIWTEELQEPPNSLEAGGAELDLWRRCSECNRDIHLGNDGRLGLLWSAINVELVTYRRLRVGDPWMSDNINLGDMLESLKRDCEPDFPLFRDNMMKQCCSCGSFGRLGRDECIGPNNACAFYFSNMEDWSRTTFLAFPIRIWWYNDESDSDEDDSDEDDSDEDDGDEDDDDMLLDKGAEEDEEMQDVSDLPIAENGPSDGHIHVVEDRFDANAWASGHDWLW
jgi:hypothetical protein